MGSIDDFTYVVEDSGLHLLLFDERRFTEIAETLRERCAPLHDIVAIGGANMNLAAGEQPIGTAAVPVAPEAIARIGYTGGTTGRPKGIVLSQRTMTAMTVIQLTEWGWPAEVRTLICAPFSHSGKSVLIPTLMLGGAIVMLDGFEPGRFLAAVERHRATSTLPVPTMIYALLDDPRSAAADLSSLEVIYYYGASSIAPERLAEAIDWFGPIFCQFYGQSEAPITVTVMRANDHDARDLRRLASCGRPVWWMRVALLDDAGAEVSDGQPGELCCRGPLVMDEYLGKPAETAAALAGGWLHTGDVAVRDLDGFLRIVDRKKDMIVTGGFNVYPREIEDAQSNANRSPPAAAVSLRRAA